MGFMALSDFRTDVNTALGNRGLPNAQVDRWVNFGYLEVTSAVRFEVLDGTDTIATVMSQNYIVAPTEVQYIRLVRDTSNDYLLGWVPKNVYYMKLQATSDVPKVWTRDGLNILLHPVPDAAYNLDVVSKKTPTLLSGDGDVTVLSDAWDPVILALAIHYGLLTLNEEQRALVWLQRAVAYAASRLTEEDLEIETRGLENSLAPGTSFAAKLRQGS